MDVCLMEALEMRRYRGKAIEGDCLSEEMMTFPFMNYYESCNGCMICVDECPVEALEIIIGDKTEEIELILNN